MLIVLIVFGPGKFPELGEGVGDTLSNPQGGMESYGGVLFVAKGTNPALGRPNEDVNLIQLAASLRYPSFRLRRAWMQD
jgi:mttA/Hcf106 family protein